MSGKWVPFLVGLVVGVIFSSTLKGVVGKAG